MRKSYILIFTAVSLIFSFFNKVQAQTIVSAGATLITESCVPANGVIDEGETVTVSFCVQNTGGANTTNLVGTLQPTGGVGAPSGPQNYGVVIAGGPPVCRNFTFVAIATCGTNLVASIQFQDGVSNLGTVTYTFFIGTQLVAFSENFDALVAPALPAGWVTSQPTNIPGSPPWVTSNAGTPAPPFASAPNSIFSVDPSNILDNIIETPAIPITTAFSQLRFSNNFNLESTFDGGVLEIKIGAGAYTDIIAAGGSFVGGGYTGTISSAFGSPIASRQAWTGSSAGFITTTVNLPAAAAGQSIRLRFRMASDNSVASIGWRVDDVRITDGATCCVSPCIPPAILTNPVDRTICAGGNTTFAITVFGSGPLTYQWQISTTGAGGPWINLVNVAPFSNVTTATLNVTAAGTVYNGNFFRCVVNNACGTANSTAASLTVNPLPVVNSGPSGLCAPVTITASGNANTYAWAPATGLNTTTGPVVIASPTVTTVYTVTGTITATGCTNTASVTVLGTPVTPVITPAAPVICAGTIQPLTVPGTAMSFTGGAITIPAGAPGVTSGIAAPYPSVINVSGLPTTGVSVKSVNINGISHTFPADIDMLLQSPTGTNVIIMSDAGGGTDIVNANLVFDDAAAGILPAVIVSGTYRPTNTAGPDNFPAPGPGSITNVNPTLSTFAGNPNGNWNLYINDQFGGDVGSITSWSITFSIPTAVWTPVTGLYSNAAATIPYVAGTPASTVYFLQSPLVTTTYTYTVTNVLGTCSSGSATVTVTVNPVPVISVAPNNQCGPVTLTATGNSDTYSWAPAYGLNTTTGPTVNANPGLNTTYTVTGRFTATGCTNTATATVNATPAAPTAVPSSVSICLGSITQLSVTPGAVTSNTAATITIPVGAPAATSGIASPYPATLSVGGLPATGVRVKSVNINGITHTFPADIDMLLQSPTGTNVIIMSDAGGGTDIINGNLVFDDAAAGILPAVIVSGTYKPTNTAGPDNFPAPGPGSITNINPTLSTFTGNLNGTWNLYINDQFGGDFGSITSWSITFEIVGAVWTPVTGLFNDPTATVGYTAGTMTNTLYAKPATTTTYSVTRASATCTSPATNVTVTVIQPITITTQPASQTVCQGTTVTFSIVTGGNFQSYQWQISTNGGSTWSNIANANNSSLILPSVTTALTGNQYRVIVTNTCSSVTSNAATLTVNPLPVITLASLPSRICISDTLISLLGIGSPVGGSWSGLGVSGFNFIPPATAPGTFTLTYTYTSGAGCTSTATVQVKVEDCPERIRLLRENAVILYPNPNNGQFYIRINSVLYNYLNMKVFTSNGRLVRNQEFGGLVYGRVIGINLGDLPADVYMVKFYYKDGARTSQKAFKVVIGAHQ